MHTLKVRSEAFPEGIVINAEDFRAGEHEVVDDDKPSKPFSATAAADEIQELKGKVSALEQALKDSAEANDDLDAANATLRARVAELEKQLTAAKAQSTETAADTKADPSAGDTKAEITKPVVARRAAAGK